MTADWIPVLAEFLGGWEIVLILAVILILFSAGVLPDLAHRTQQPERATGVSRSDEFILWIAQGFDVGRIPVAPGTFGSMVGVLWFAVLIVPGSFPLFLAGTALGLVMSVWFCGEAERILKQTDPGSVVLDEIAAIPVCFLPWLVSELRRLEEMPPVETFFSGRGLIVTGAIFVLFRVFDVVKPWPVRQSQELPGGLGVTMDDVLAAVYVALITLAVLLVSPFRA